MWSHTNRLFAQCLSQRSARQDWAGDRASQTLNLSPAIQWITNQGTFTAHNRIQLFCHLLPGLPKSRCSGKFCPDSTKVLRHSWRRAIFLIILPGLDCPALQCFPAARAILPGPRTAKASTSWFFLPGQTRVILPQRQQQKLMYHTPFSSVTPKLSSV